MSLLDLFKKNKEEGGEKRMTTKTIKGMDSKQYHRQYYRKRREKKLDNNNIEPNKLESIKKIRNLLNELNGNGNRGEISTIKTELAVLEKRYKPTRLPFIIKFVSVSKERKSKFEEKFYNFVERSKDEFPNDEIKVNQLSDCG